MWYTTWVRENAPCGFPQNTPSAGMVELVDSVDLGSTAKSVQVRVLLPAPNQNNPNQIFPVGDGFGLFVFFGRFGETHFQNGVIKRSESKPRGPRKKNRFHKAALWKGRRVWKNRSSENHQRTHWSLRCDWQQRANRQHCYGADQLIRLIMKAQLRVSTRTVPCDTHYSKGSFSRKLRVANRGLRATNKGLRVANAPLRVANRVSV